MHRAAPFLAAVLLLGPVARADPSPGLPDSPPPGPDHGKVATCDATPVGAGRLEIELAYSPALTQRGMGGFERSTHAHTQALVFSLTHGLADDVDVRLAAGVGEAMERTAPGQSRTGTGATDLALGARWRFLADAERGLDLAVSATAVAPTGRPASDRAPGLTQGYWSVRGALVASKDWGSTTANAELAVVLPAARRSGVGGAAFASLALGHALRPWLQPMAELSYDAAREGPLRQRLAVAAGLSLTGQAGERLLAGVQQAVWGRHQRQAVSALLALKLAL
ncbi:MAG: transporter [Deltaproteobacteria bacterium]|nr:transporter [Deltaproteobacteria bacterium]